MFLLAKFISVCCKALDIFPSWCCFVLHTHKHIFVCAALRYYTIRLFSCKTHWLFSLPTCCIGWWVPFKRGRTRGATGIKFGKINTKSMRYIQFYLIFIFVVVLDKVLTILFNEEDKLNFWQFYLIPNRCSIFYFLSRLFNMELDTCSLYFCFPLVFHFTLLVYCWS